MKERLRKIYELSVKGVGGEREAAQKLLQNLLKKHGLTLDAITDEAKTERQFKPKDILYKRLLCQIISKVTNSDDRAIYTYKRRQGLFIELTAAEFIEVDLLFTEYSQSFGKEQDTLLKAFIYTNDIFAADGTKSTKSDLTDDEIREWKRAMSMAQSITPTPITRKRLEAAA
jgi:hypothetical protein